MDSTPPTPPSPAKSKISTKDFADPREVTLIWQEAMYEASLTKGIISISWKHVPYIDKVLFNFHYKFGKPLLQLRLIGVKLKTFHEEFATNFQEIEVLALENNKLEQIPDNITQLTQLRELYLANNFLQFLPERIGFLCNLSSFSINNNRLQALPVTFAALNMLRRVDLECNELRFLPDNFDNLTSCEVLNLNRNKLVRLPHSIGYMPSLTSLSASWNELTQLPAELCHSKTLTIIRMAMNKLHALPERLGQLGETLTELTVEYNQLKSLPLSFYKLRQLRVFRCEGNDGILDPPAEILTQGARAVVQYCINQYFFDKDARMRHIVLCIQNTLLQVTEMNLYDPAYFEHDAHLPFGDDNAEQDPDAYYVLQMSYFWSTLLPKMKSQWLMMEQQGVYEVQASNYNNDNVTDFEFTEREVMWALTHYSDAMGPVLLRQPARFRRCACIDPVTKQPKPCIPPKVGYMCERSAIWIKAKLVRSRDKAERKWTAYKVDHENDAVKRAELEALEYLNSRAGQRWLDETAADQAEDVLLEQTVDKIVQKRIKDTEKAKEKVLKKFDAMIIRVQRIKDDKFKKLQKEVDDIKEQLRTTREGYLKNVLQKRLEETSKAMADIPEIEQLQNLQKQCQKQIEALEHELYKGIESEDDATTKKKKQKKKNRKARKNKEKEESAAAKKKKEEAGKKDESQAEDVASELSGEEEEEEEGDEEDGNANGEGAESSGTDVFVSDEEDDMIECMDSDELREVVDRDRRDIARGEQLYDSDDSCEEARTYRRLRLKRMKRLQHLDDLKRLQKEEHQHIRRQIVQLKRDKNKQSLRLAVDLLMLQAAHRNRVIAETLQSTHLHKQVLKPMQRYLREQRVHARRKLRDLIEISKIRTAKMLRRLNGDFNEVMRELKYEIRRQYIAHAMQQARDAARHEFSVIEKVRSKMLGASLEVTFIAWKKYVWTKTERERRDKRRLYKQACKHYETSMESVRSAQLQAAMWHYQIDLYSDRPYWQHRRTGDVTYDEPTMYHYLPWNFVLPTLPEELPSDISLNTTEASDLEEDEAQRLAARNKGVVVAKASGTVGQLDAAQRQELNQAVRDAFQDQQSISSNTTIDKNKRRGVNSEGGEESKKEAKSKKSVHEELLRWQQKYGRKRHAAEQADEQKRAERRQRRQRYREQIETAAEVANLTLTASAQKEAEKVKRDRRANRLGIVPYELGGYDGGDADGEGEEDNGRVLTAFDPSDLIAPLEQRITETSEHLVEKTKNEYEIAYKAIRRKRNQLNPARHHMYLSHVNRKPKSMEQWRVEEQEKEAKEKEEHRLEIEPGVFIDDRQVDLVNPSQEELLRMAGANIDMIYTGKAGLELRSVIAARALHIKEKLHQRAIERGLLSRAHDHNTFYRKEIKPFFMHRYDGSSSSEDTDEDDDEIEKRKTRKRVDENGEEIEEEGEDEEGGGTGRGFAQSLLGMFGFGGRAKKTVSKQATLRTREAALDPQGKKREGRKARERHRELIRREKNARHRDREYHGRVEDTRAERQEAIRNGESPEKK